MPEPGDLVDRIAELFPDGPIARLLERSEQARANEDALREVSDRAETLVEAAIEGDEEAETLFLSLFVEREQAEKALTHLQREGYGYMKTAAALPLIIAAKVAAMELLEEGSSYRLPVELRPYAEQLDLAVEVFFLLFLDAARGERSQLDRSEGGKARARMYLDRDREIVAAAEELQNEHENWSKRQIAKKIAPEYELNWKTVDGIWREAFKNRSG